MEKRKFLYHDNKIKLFIGGRRRNIQEAQEQDLNSDKKLLSRLSDKDKAFPGVKELLKLGFIPIISAKQHSEFITHSAELRKTEFKVLF